MYVEQKNGRFLIKRKRCREAELSTNIRQGIPIRFLVLLAVLVFLVAAQAADRIGAVKSVIFYACGSPPGDSHKPIYLNDAIFAEGSG